MKNDLLLRALCMNNFEQIQPVWFMRQAGRYMKSYRMLREKYSFEELCYVPEHIVEVTLQPIHTFDLDAAIVFSDILFPLRCIGITVQFSDSGPILRAPDKIVPVADFKTALHIEMGPLYTAIKTLSSMLSCPLIGFAGSPWTLLSFIIEGQSSQSYCKACSFLQNHPKKAKTLLLLLEDLVVAHLRLQIDHGCGVIQLFDSHSHLVPPNLLSTVCIEPFKRIKKRLNFHYCIYYKATPSAIPLLSNEAISIDNFEKIPHPENHTGPVQGGLPPLLLTQNRSILQQNATTLRSIMKNHPGYIWNLSAGIVPQTDESTIRFLVDFIRNTPS